MADGKRREWCNLLSYMASVLCHAIGGENAPSPQEINPLLTAEDAIEYAPDFGAFMAGTGVEIKNSSRKIE